MIDWLAGLVARRTDRLQSRKSSGTASLETKMKQNVVVMPTLTRTEMLALSLESIRRSPESNDIDVRIYVDCCDQAKLDEVDYVRDNYYPEATIYLAQPHIEAPSGCWNILFALKEGYKTGAEFIFLVEEDCMISSDFFRKHYEMQRTGLYFATCGRLRKEYQSDYYTNPGSCFHRESLRQIVPHINDTFFKDRRGYMDRFFGVFDEASDLDDGLIRRVIRAVNGRVGYPTMPIVAHQGFRAYNHYQGYINEGTTIQEKIENLRSILPKVNPNDRYTRDFEPGV